MRYYVTDAEGRVVGKFDGVDIDIPNGYDRVVVETVEELSEIAVDEWEESLLDNR